MNKFNIVIVGVGGQGVLLTAEILGTAALKEDYNVRVSEIHGMAQRGGTVVCDVRIGEKVYAPTTPKGMADIILGLEPLETIRHIEYASPTTLIIMNTNLVKPVSVSIGASKCPSINEIIKKIHQFCNNLLPVDALKMANNIGNPATQNTILLGVLASTGKLPFGVEALRSSLFELVPSKYVEVNKKAFQMGMDFQ